MRTAAEFWASVADPDENGCRLWLGAISGPPRGGYGALWWRTDEGKRRLGAHRIAWELTHGPIPPGLFVCHRCDVRACVNPEHVVQVSRSAIAGRELGLGPVESMRAFYVIDSRIEFAAEFLAQRVRLHPRYDYKVLEIENDRCSIAMFEDGEQIGVSTFTEKDREKAGLALETSKGGATPWAKFPRSMMFARAISNAVAWFAPDVVAGTGLTVVIDVVKPVEDEGMVPDEMSGQPGQTSAHFGAETPSSSASTVEIGDDSTDPAVGSSEAGSHAPEDLSAETSVPTTTGDAPEEEPDTDAAPPLGAPEPHEHIAGPQRLASGKALCIFEYPDGRVCGTPVKIVAPTVHTAPIDEAEERKDIA